MIILMIFYWAIFVVLICLIHPGIYNFPLNFCIDYPNLFIIKLNRADWILSSISPPIQFIRLHTDNKMHHLHVHF